MQLFGYIDPGTGSLFIQSVIGVGLAVAVVFRSFLGKVLIKVRGIFAKQSVNNEGE